MSTNAKSPRAKKGGTNIFGVCRLAFLAGLVGIGLASQPASASLLNNSTGLSNPGTTITFGTNDFVPGTPITSQYAGQGLANAGGLLYSNLSYSGVFNGSTGAYLLNFDENNPVAFTSQFTLSFASMLSQAAFVLATDSNATLTALLGGTTVESFAVSPQDTVFGDSFYGFTGISFDSIRIDTTGDYAALIDTVQFNTTAVPEPATLALLGIGLAGLGLSRRKRTSV